jgi:hypothetical protein
VRSHFAWTFPLKLERSDQANPNWGLRDLEAVAAMAQSVGFSAPVITEMPGKQSERSVPQNMIVVPWTTPANGRF